jgi:serine/threonine protein kinase
MITSEGRVKILDFGLAHKEVAVSEIPNAAGAAAPVHITEPGRILDIPSYMSPEQTSGEAADYGSDEFSLGPDSLNRHP